MIGINNPIAGWIANPYFLGSAPIGQARHFTHRDYDIFLVSHLDGYTAEDVRGLVDRSLQASGEGRVILDAKSDSLAKGDDWLRRAAENMKSIGRENLVVLETSDKVAGSDGPVSGYYSWGSNDPAIRTRLLGFHFSSGALAGMFVSSDARTFQEPPPEWRAGPWDGKSPEFAGSPQSLSGDLIREGVTGIVGHVAEPFLEAAARPDILFPAYFSGFNAVCGTMWTAAFPEYGTSAMIPFLASTGQFPHSPLGTQLPTSSLVHPPEPGTNDVFLRALWRLWGLFHDERDITVGNEHNGCRSVKVRNAMVLCAAALSIILFNEGISYVETARSTTSDYFETTPDTLYIVSGARLSEIKYDNEISIPHEEYEIFISDEKKELYIRTFIDIDRSEENTVSLEIYRRSAGRNRNDALRKAEELIYNYRISGDSLIIDEFSRIPPGRKWSFDEVWLRVYAPEGTVIIMDRITENLYHSGDENYFRSDPSNRQWFMTEEGLERIGQRMRIVE